MELKIREIANPSTQDCQKKVIGSIIETIVIK
jgi:hypothetical protein